MFTRISFLGLVSVCCSLARAEEVSSGSTNLQFKETDEWLKIDDDHTWSGIDHFLSAWRGDGPLDPEPLQEKIFQARYAVMEATAHPDDSEQGGRVRKAFTAICEAFCPEKRNDCLSQITERKELLCKDAVVADAQNKVCSKMLERALSLSASDAQPEPPKRFTRFKLPGVHVHNKT